MAIALSEREQLDKFETVTTLLAAAKSPTLQPETRYEMLCVAMFELADVRDNLARMFR